MNAILKQVVSSGRCCCCGLCAAVCPQRRLTVQESDFGEYFPYNLDAGSLDSNNHCSNTCNLCVRVCPMTRSNNIAVAGILSEDNNERATDTYQPDRQAYAGAAYAGAVAVESERLKAPSGGFATALLCRLHEEGKINAAVVASPTKDRPWFERRIATTTDEILQSRGSVYHVLKNDSVLREILDGPERLYAVVALPCMAKAIRHAQAVFPKLQRRIKYIFGLTCGGCNTLHVPDLLTVMLGDRHSGLCYRSKANSKNASDYSITLFDVSQRAAIKMLGPYGFLWGNRIGRMICCFYCNDVLADDADATFMDAWLPEYIPDVRGTSLALVRNGELTGIFEAMFNDGTFQGSAISPGRVHESQASLVAERKRCSRIFHALAAGSSASDGKASASLQDLRWGRRVLAFHRDMRELFRYYSHCLARKPNWYSRFYIIRLFWLIFLSLVWYRLLGKSLRMLRYLRK